MQFSCIYNFNLQLKIKINMRQHHGTKEAHPEKEVPMIQSKTETSSSCPYCDTFQTSWKKELRTHINSKHGPCPPYPCNHTGCSYTSKKLYLLMLHLQTHSNECKFCCDFEGCAFAATTVHKLKFHKSTIHNPEREIRCSECNKQFTTKASLQMHMVVIHASSDNVKVNYN